MVKMIPQINREKLHHASYDIKKMPLLPELTTLDACLSCTVYENRHKVILGIT